MLATAVLFIRPTDIIPGMEEFQLYLVLILACAVTSAPVVLGQCTSQAIFAEPVSFCVIGVLGCASVSSLINLGPAAMVSSTFELSKQILYYLLVVGLFDRRAGSARSFSASD